MCNVDLRTLSHGQTSPLHQVAYRSDSTTTKNTTQSTLVFRAIAVLVPTITNIVNLSLSFGQFHPTLNQSTISPLLKKRNLDKDQL